MSCIIEQLTPHFGRQEARALAQWIAEEPEGSYDPEEVVRRLLNGEPVQYIFGHTDWRGLRLALNEDTLIPRPETSELVDAILADYPADSQLSVLDIGTGSGCIAIALKKARPHWHIAACDISESALQVARQNAETNLPSSPTPLPPLSRGAVAAGGITFFPCDILTQIPEFPPKQGGQGGLLVSNPPYIMDSERATMETNVLDHEPHRALFVPDADPFLFYRRIASLHLAPVLYFEINERFGQETAAAVRQEGYSSTQIRQDLCGKDRILIARR